MKKLQVRAIFNVGMCDAVDMQRFMSTWRAVPRDSMTKSEEAEMATKVYLAMKTTARRSRPKGSAENSTKNYGCELPSKPY